MNFLSIPLSILLLVATTNSTTSEVTQQNGLATATVHTATHQAETKATYMVQERILKQIDIQRDKEKFEFASPLPETGLASDIYTLLWIAPRGGAGIEGGTEVRDSEVAMIQSSLQEQAGDSHTWVRFYYKPYKPEPGVNFIAHQDVMLYVEKEQPDQAVLAVQDPDQPETWTLYQLPGYGSWLQREIDMYLRTQTGL